MNKQLAFCTIINKLIEIKSFLEEKQEKPLTFKIAAEYLGISKSYLYKLTSLNKVPNYKPFGKKIYFRQSELNNWVFGKKLRSNKEIEKLAENYINKTKSKFI